MVINALNSGASVFMADFEDANTPTWDNIVDGQINSRRRPSHDRVHGAGTGKKYALKEKTAVLSCGRAAGTSSRGTCCVDGEPIPGGLFDFGLFFFHNAKEPLAARHRAVFLPAQDGEPPRGAALERRVRLRAGAPRRPAAARSRRPCLIETLPAAFEMDEFLYELREHSAGLNCGRWDYIFSFIKKHARTIRRAVLPDRAQVTMDKAFLAAYVKLLIKTCHRRGVHAMGGMAAQIPIKDDPRGQRGRAREGARRQASRGRRPATTERGSRTRASSPSREDVFDAHMPGPNQLGVAARRRAASAAEDLLRVPEGQRTEAGLRHNVRVGIQYLEAWLRGNGCVPLYNLMEDAATAEISARRSGSGSTTRRAARRRRRSRATRFARVVEEEMQRVRREVGDARFQGGRFPRRATCSCASRRRPSSKSS